MKKVILEQLSNEEQKNILTKALQFGCFFKDDEGTPYHLVNTGKEPIEVDGRVVVVTYDKQSEQKLYIYAEPRIIQNTKSGNMYPWDCAKLNEDLKKAKQETKPTSEIEKTPEKVELNPEEKKEVQNIDQVIKDLQSQIEEQKPENCRKSINALYDFYTKAKKGYKVDNSKIQILRDNSQKCLDTPEIKRQLFFSKLPLVGDKLQKRIKTLQSINQLDTLVGNFRLLENDITTLVKKTLIEELNRKENQLVENKIVESRVKIILENLEDFNKLTLSKKVKTGFKMLKEIATLQKMGLINENLGSLFKGMYGKSYETSIGSISEPMFTVIFKKISLDEDLTSKILQNIQSKTSELIASMENCQTLSKFLTDVIIEEYAKKLDQEKSQKTDLVYSSFMDSVDEEMFRQNLNTKLDDVVCRLYDKFTENAKNLMVRMTSL